MDAQTAQQQFQQADRLYREGRYAEALALLNALNKEFPNTKNLMYAAALCLEKVGNIEEAKFLCNALIRQFDYGKAKELLTSIESTPQINAQLDDLLYKDILSERKKPVPPLPSAAPSNTKKYVLFGIIVAAVAILGVAVLFGGNGGSAASSTPEQSLGSIFLIVFLIGLGCYGFYCYLMKRICENAGTEPGVLIWMPLLQIVPIFKAAEMSLLWILALFIPFAGALLVTVILWVKLCQACNKPAWLGILALLPFVNLILAIYLAFSSPD